MKVIKRIAFRNDTSSDFFEYLKDNHFDINSSEIISVVRVCTSDPCWSVVSEYVKKYNLNVDNETEYTKQELLDAEWLTMRSTWRFGYPQPEDSFRFQKITYNEKTICSECDSGLIQIAPFRIKKTPKWGKRYFAELNWVGDELFVNSEIAKLFNDNCITGVSFMEVHSKNGEQVFPDILQLVVPTVIKEGLNAKGTRIFQSETCAKCGYTKHVTAGYGMYEFDKEIFNNQPDVVKTGDLFGSMHYCARKIIVRQKVYRLITRNKLDRALVFEPIKLI